MTDPIEELSGAQELILGRDLPPPGSGSTIERFALLWELGAGAPAVGRLGEAHHDAIAILREAGRMPHDPNVLHAVWAAGGPDPLQLDRRSGGWRLHGARHWCSGASLARAALVTADVTGHGGALVLVGLPQIGATVDVSDWQSPALTAVDTRTIHFDLEVADDDVVGTNDWYLRRPGFWHGAVGVAACWAGCIDGIVGRVRGFWRDDPHALAHLGAIDAALWNVRVAIEAAAREIDESPGGPEREGHRRALRVRHIVDLAAASIADHLTRALGPGPLAHLPDLHRHLAETDIYRRQCHAERDLEILGRFSSEAPG